MAEPTRTTIIGGVSKMDAILNEQVGWGKRASTEKCGMLTGDSRAHATLELKARVRGDSGCMNC